MYYFCKQGLKINTTKILEGLHFQNCKLQTFVLKSDQVKNLRNLNLKTTSLLTLLKQLKQLKSFININNILCQMVTF